MHSPKRKPLRRPFVATFAGAAAVVATACGGNIVGVGPDGTNPNPPPGPTNGAECPTAAPADGAPCETPKAFCLYGEMCESNSLGATCEADRRWSVERPPSGCNPPPPPVACPATPPTRGAHCWAIGLSCDYGPYCDSRPMNHATCGDDYQWQLGASSCNPPPPPQCPNEPPVDGTSCNVPLECSYGNCHGESTVQASCSDTTWRVLTQSCNPPPPALDAGSSG